MIVRHKNTWQVLFKYNGKRYRRGFGAATNMNLKMAQKYVRRIKDLRTECKASKTPLPDTPPLTERIPKLGQLIAKYQSFTQSGDSMPMELLMQVIDRSRELKMTQEEHLKFVEQCEANYKQLIEEQKAKTAATVNKRKATIAAKKAKLDNTSAA